MAGERGLRVKRRLQGVAFLAVVAALLGLTIAVYNKALPWQSTKEVILEADRAGNQLVVPADVKLEGVLVGRVSGVSTKGELARMTLQIQPSKMKLIPANVVARILPKTLFGEKFVQLVIPDSPTGELQPGAVIAQDRSETAIELQTVFSHLVPLLRTLKPAELSVTLSNLADALRGRGDALGHNLELVNQYFSGFNPDLPTFTHDLGALADMASTYADATPDLMAMLRNFSVNARTLTEKQDVFARFLAGSSDFASTAADVFGDNANRLIQLADVSAPVTHLYAKYSPVLECLPNGLAIYDRTRLEQAFGAGPFLHITLTPVGDRGAYTPADKPLKTDITSLKLPPNCFGLPHRRQGPAPGQQPLPRRAPPGQLRLRRLRRPAGRQLHRAPGRAAGGSRRLQAVGHRPGVGCRREAAVGGQPRHCGRGARTGARHRHARADARTRHVDDVAGPPGPAARAHPARDGGEHLVTGHTLSAFVKLMIFTIVTVLATAVLAVTISNRTFGDTRSFKARFTDVTSLLAGDSVRAAGVRVGTVKSIKVVDDHDAEVTFDVDKTVPIRTTTKLQVRYLNLVGQRYIAIIEQPGAGADQPQDSVIPLARTAPALDLTALFNGFRPLFQALSPDDVNAFSMEVIKTLQGEGGTVADLVQRSASLTNTVADRDAAIGGVVNNLLKVLDTVEQRDQGLNQLIVQLQRLVTGLAGDRDAIAASLSHIDDLASNSALLLQQIRPYVPSDLKNLSGIAHNLNRTKNCSNYLLPLTDKNKFPKVDRFANNKCSGPNTLDEYLKRAPTKLIQIIRTATYGSYFNFYLCDLEMTGQLGQLLEDNGVKPTIVVNVPACGS